MANSSAPPLAQEQGDIDIFQKLVSVARSPDKKMASLARWIMDHQADAGDLTITALAQQTQVSETTVFRFCKLLGLGGYKDLRLALVEGRGLARGTQLAGGTSGAIPHDGGEYSAILRRVIESNTEQLLKTASSVSLSALKDATDLLLSSNHVNLVGFGSSAPIAYDAYRRFISLGLTASMHSDPHMLAAATANARAGTLFLGVSCSGRTRDLIEAFETVGSKGLKRIVLTSDPTAPVTAVSDVTLISAVRRSPLGLDVVSTRISQLAIIEAICVALVETAPQGLGLSGDAGNLKREIEKKRLAPAKSQNSSSGSEGAGS